LLVKLTLWEFPLDRSLWADHQGVTPPAVDFRWSNPRALHRCPQSIVKKRGKLLKEEEKIINGIKWTKCKKA